MPLSPSSPPVPAAAGGRDLFVVGDVHGCADELAALLDRAGFDPARHHLVLVGDVFAKGPDPAGVFRTVRTAGGEMVLGNHDVALLARREGLAHRPAGDRGWDPHGWCARVLTEEAPGAWGLLESAPLVLTSGATWVLHAGLDPAVGLAATSREDVLTVRRLAGGPGAPFWWERWEGPETVVFGHDAKRGLVRRVHRGRTVALGLDTGCVYGGRLTGWFAGEDRLTSVAARRAYSPLARPVPPGPPGRSSGSPGSPPVP
ncbi:metallophosphoesterase [Myxococcota bacterium]|nr:metallophosphoesterase [Myxococcota bacterium]